MHAPADHSAVPPFFIVGNDRSGTTMLRLILDRAPEAAIPTESMIVSDFAGVRRQVGSLADRVAAREFCQRVWTHPKIRLWQLGGAAPAPPAGLSHEDAYRFAIEAPYKAYAAAHGKQWWGDKTPSYIHHIDELLAVWPHARVINIVRDGRDVALSLRRMPFGANNVWSAACEWSRSVRLGVEAAARYPKNVMSVRYEDIVADPGAIVPRLCAFVGLTYSDDMLHIEQTPPDRLVSDQAEWFTNLWAGINQNAVGKWRRQMTRAQLQVFASVAGRELRAYGYDLGGARETSLSSAKAMGFRAHNFAMRLVNFVRLRLVQERGRELRYVLARRLERA